MGTLFMSDINTQKFSAILSNRLDKGFKIVEQNDKLPFIVLQREGKKIDHYSHFLMSCATLGIWSLAWIYLSQVSSKTKKILVAIDEDGVPFEEDCYMEKV
jgi:hypothetical protein